MLLLVLILMLVLLVQLPGPAVLLWCGVLVLVCVSAPRCLGVSCTCACAAPALRLCRVLLVQQHHQSTDPVYGSFEECLAAMNVLYSSPDVDEWWTAECTPEEQELFRCVSVARPAGPAATMCAASLIHRDVAIIV